jgi:hypothetical protein
LSLAQDTGGLTAEGMAILNSLWDSWQKWSKRYLGTRLGKMNYKVKDMDAAIRQSAQLGVTYPFFVRCHRCSILMHQCNQSSQAVTSHDKKHSHIRVVLGLYNIPSSLHSSNRPLQTHPDCPSPIRYFCRSLSLDKAPCNRIVLRSPT